MQHRSLEIRQLAQAPEGWVYAKINSLATQERFSVEGEAEATAASVAMKTVMSCILMVKTSCLVDRLIDVVD
jgi:hypothetical protein